MHENEIKKNDSFSKNIAQYIDHIEAQAEIYPIIMELLNAKAIQESRSIEKYIEQNQIIEENESEENETNLIIPFDKINGFIKKVQNIKRTSLAADLLPINIVVSFVSQFDAYLGDLIRTMFFIKPELVNSSEKNLQFTDLINFNSIEDAREFVVEKEIESVLRESHLKQFEWLEKKLGIPLRKDLPSFSDFIEITERRNLFVHGNGIVSRQYIDVCTKNNVQNISDNLLGKKLKVEPEYFKKCYLVLFEIGVKLGQVIWRKLQPEKVEDADDDLNNICYELLIRGEYKLSRNLLNFALNIKKISSQNIRCIFTINKALSFYLDDEKDKCNEVLDEFDWSASNNIFKLAVAVLKDNYETAILYMKRLGNHENSENSEINKKSYLDWPLFTEFRKDSEFKKAFEDIFGEPLVYKEEKPKKITDILLELKKDSSEGEVGISHTPSPSSTIPQAPPI